jgi:hypothetical protein
MKTEVGQIEILLTLPVRMARRQNVRVRLERLSSSRDGVHLGPEKETCRQD